MSRSGGVGGWSGGEWVGGGVAEWRSAGGVWLGAGGRKGVDD